VVRIYAQTTWAAGSTLSVQVHNVLLSEDDPSLNLAEGRATTQTIGAVTAPAYFVKALDLPIGAQLGVTLKPTMSTTAGQQIFTIGVDVVGRPA